MGTVRKQYTKEFKEEAVRLITQGSVSLSQASRDLDINQNILRRWKQESERHGVKAFPGQGEGVAVRRGRGARVGSPATRERGAAPGTRSCAKSHLYLLATQALKHQFILDHKNQFPITLLCRVLSVSQSAFYVWTKRPPSPHQQRDELLAHTIEQVFHQAEGVMEARVFIRNCGLVDTGASPSGWRV